MADTLTPEEQAAIDAFPEAAVTEVPTRTPEEIIAAGYEPARGSYFGHDKKPTSGRNAIKRAQDATRRRKARERKFAKAAGKPATGGTGSVNRARAEAREKRLRALLAEGLSTPEIAAAMACSRDALRVFAKSRGISLRGQG